MKSPQEWTITKYDALGKTPVDLNVRLFVSPTTLKYGSFRFSTIAPESFGTNYFGRNMLQITEEFQNPLGPWTPQTIPAGTFINVGLVGPQPGLLPGTWLQIYAPEKVPFIKP